MFFITCPVDCWIEQCSNIEEIDVGSQEYGGDRFEIDFSVNVAYSKQNILESVFSKIEKRIMQKFRPIKLKVEEIEDGFIGAVDVDDMHEIRRTPITAYSKSDIMNEGLSVSVRVAKYEHKVKDVQISCEYMKKKKTKSNFC